MIVETMTDDEIFEELIQVAVELKKDYIGDKYIEKPMTEKIKSKKNTCISPYPIEEKILINTFRNNISVQAYCCCPSANKLKWKIALVASFFFGNNIKRYAIFEYDEYSLKPRILLLSDHFIKRYRERKLNDISIGYDDVVMDFVKNGGCCVMPIEPNVQSCKLTDTECEAKPEYFAKSGDTYVFACGSIDKIIFKTAITKEMLYANQESLVNQLEYLVYRTQLYRLY